MRRGVRAVDEARICTFPIPMRGNEIQPTEDESKLFMRFPIPMRGNEEVMRTGLTRADLLVPEPHEG